MERFRIEIHTHVEDRSDFSRAYEVHIYELRINGKIVIFGARDSQHGAKRAAHAQLKQLQKDIERQLKTL